MKVVILVPVFVTGGAEIMAKRLATHLDRSQIQVEVVAVYPPLGNALEEDIRQAGIPLHFIGKEKGREPQAMVRLWKLLNEIRPDIIHSHMYSVFYGLPWAAAHGVPLLHTIHSRPDKEFSPKLRKVLAWFLKGGKLHFAAISRKNCQLVAEHYHIPQEQVPWVNNPVETQRYYKAPRRDADNVAFVSLGRLEYVKNQMLMVRAMPRVLEAIPNAKLILFGEGSRKTQLEAEVQRLGLQNAVEFPGNCQEPEHALAKADVYLNTSHWEGLPLSILEAEAAYLPVIATRVGGVPDIVRDNGVLIEDDDLDALVREMIRFGSDPQLRKHCGELSRAIAKEFDADLCARKYEQIYRSILKK